MKRPQFKIILFLYIFTTNICFSQTNKDSISSVISGINFENDYEKELFENYFLEDQKNYFDLFYIIEESTSERKTAQQFVEEQVVPIRASVLKTKNRKRKIKLIFNRIHEGMFVFYNEPALFPHIFSNGSYNCVTGTALYAIVLEQFDIPYKIIELTNHVYIVAYPDEDEIIIESTNPEKGYLNVSDNYKEEYIKYLKKIKLINNEDLMLNTSKLFEKYYYENGKIDIQQLLGIHYYNNSLFLLINGDFQLSVQQIEKGLLFYNCPRLLMLYQSALGIQLSKQSYVNKEAVSYFVKYLKHFVGDENRTELLSEFGRLTHSQLIEYPDEELYEASYQLINSNISDSILKAEIGYIYNYEKGRAYQLKGDLAKCYPYLEKALAYKPENIELQSWITSIVTSTIYKIKDHDVAKDSLLSFKAMHPELIHYNSFKLTLSYVYIRSAFKALMDRKITQANKDLNDFEASVDLEVLNYELQDYIGNLYSEMSSYYFRKQNRTKAKEFIKRGLVYAPGNRSLLTKRQLMKQY